jgi:hypothetical protein
LALVVTNQYVHIANEEHSWTLIMNTTSVLEIFYVLSTLVFSMLVALLDFYDYHYYLPCSWEKVDLLPDIDHEYHLREGDISQILLACFFLGNIALFLQLPQSSLLQERMKRKYFTFAFCSIFGLLQYSQRFTGIIAYAFIILRIFEKSHPPSLCWIDFSNPLNSEKGQLCRMSFPIYSKMHRNRKLPMQYQ